MKQNSTLDPPQESDRAWRGRIKRADEKYKRLLAEVAIENKRLTEFDEERERLIHADVLKMYEPLSRIYTGISPTMYCTKAGHGYDPTCHVALPYEILRCVLDSDTEEEI